MLRIANFSGEIPRLIPRLLPENAAQVAYNTKLENGALTPMRRGRHVKTMAKVCRTIYLNDQGEWMGWPGYVDVAPAPIADNRLYVTGDGAPKVIDKGVTYPLAVPRPQNKLTAVVQGGQPDPSLSSRVLYTYTYVTVLDEESEPAPLGDAVLWSNGMDILVHGVEAPPQGRSIDRMRLYRSQTSDAGETALYLIYEGPVSTTPFLHAAGNFPNMEPIQSLNYHAPPDELRGLRAMPNGIMVAFSGKKVYFSEPYRPHAWPEQYVLKTDYDIVGLGVFGSSVAILTNGQPYVASGIHPSAMAMERLRVNMPCVSARGIVDLGYAVAYPSHEGLVTITQQGANLVSKQLLTRDQWQQMNPFSFVAGHYSGRYLCSYDYADATGAAHRGILVLDLTGEQPFIVRSNDDGDAMFSEIGTGALYLLRNGQDIWEWDCPTEPYGEQLWRSKRFVLPGHTNFSTILVEAEDILTDFQRQAAKARIEAVREKNRELMASGKTGGTIGETAMGLLAIGASRLKPAEDEFNLGITVYADGKYVTTVYDVNTPVRLPGGFLATTWEIEVRGSLQVTAISLAHSPSELAMGA